MTVLIDVTVEILTDFKLDKEYPALQAKKLWQVTKPNMGNIVTTRTASYNTVSSSYWGSCVTCQSDSHWSENYGFSYQYAIIFYIMENSL